jgi:hypothetical protein
VRIEVESYSGYKADERPTSFCLGERRHRVTEVLDQWYGPGTTYFRVRSDDGDVYVLRHASGDAGREWTLESFRRDRRE